jgi:hypothetical protein
LAVFTQPGGTGLDIDDIFPAHNSPGVGDGVPEGCIMSRFPVIKLYGRGSLNEEYPYSSVTSPFGASLNASLFNITAENNCSISRGASSFANLATGEVSFNQLVISGCVQESLGLKFSTFGLVSVDSVPFDVFGDPHSAVITDISTNGIQAFDIRWTAPPVARLHPLLGVIFEIRACLGDCAGFTSCPSACTTSRDTCENYGLGGDGNRSCSRMCNPSELQLLPVMLSTSPTHFYQNINSTVFRGWKTCDDGFPWPSSNLCAYDSIGSHFHIGNGAVGMGIAGWPLQSCSELASILGKNGTNSVIILKPGVVYQYSAVAFNSHRVNRYTSPIFSRPSIVDDSARDAKFTMYSSVSTAPVVMQFYLTSPAPTLWRPRLGYIFDVVQMGAEFDGNPSLQSVFFWDQGCDGYQSSKPTLMQTNQNTDATYHLDEQLGYVFSMFVLNDGMPLVNKSGIMNGLLRINYTIPYTGHQLLMSSDHRYTVRVFTVNALGAGLQPSYFSFSISSIQPSVLSTDGSTVVTVFGSGLGLPNYETNMRIKINGVECTALLVTSYSGESIQFLAPRSFGRAPTWSFEMGVMSTMPIVLQGQSWFHYGAPQAWQRAQAFGSCHYCHRPTDCLLMVPQVLKVHPSIFPLSQPSRVLVTGAPPCP